MNDHKHNGFKNPGTLCYLNSLLVQYLTIDEMIELLKTNKYGTESIK